MGLERRLRGVLGPQPPGRLQDRRHLNPFGKRPSRCDTSVRTTPKALRCLIRQRSCMESEWNWARDAQLGEDAQRDANRTVVPVFSLLGPIGMNLLRRGGTAQFVKDSENWPTCATSQRSL